VRNGGVERPAPAHRIELHVKPGCPYRADAMRRTIPQASGGCSDGSFGRRDRILM
jgi:hypothetical protein